MSALVAGRNGIQTKLLWAGIAALGAVSFGIIALNGNSRPIDTMTGSIMCQPTATCCSAIILRP